MPNKITVYVLLEHEPSCEIPAFCVGVYTTREKRAAARVARIAELREESPTKVVYGEDERADDWDIDLVEDDVTLDREGV